MEVGSEYKFILTSVISDDKFSGSSLDSLKKILTDHTEGFFIRIRTIVWIDESFVPDLFKLLELSPNVRQVYLQITSDSSLIYSVIKSVFEEWKSKNNRDDIQMFTFENFSQLGETRFEFIYYNDEKSRKNTSKFEQELSLNINQQSLQNDEIYLMTLSPLTLSGKDIQPTDDASKWYNYVYPETERITDLRKHLVSHIYFPPSPRSIEIYFYSPDEVTKKTYLKKYENNYIPRSEIKGEVLPLLSSTGRTKLAISTIPHAGTGLFAGEQGFNITKGAQGEKLDLPDLDREQFKSWMKDSFIAIYGGHILSLIHI